MRRKYFPTSGSAFGESHSKGQFTHGFHVLYFLGLRNIPILHTLAGVHWEESTGSKCSEYLFTNVQDESVGSR